MINNKITLFLPAGDNTDFLSTLNEVKDNPLIEEMFIAGKALPENLQLPGKSCFSEINSLHSTNGIKRIAELTKTPYILIYTKTLFLKPVAYALERMIQVAEDTGASMVYSDHYQLKEDNLFPVPLTDYQPGSLRDDFNFGSLILYRTEDFVKAAGRMSEEYRFAGLYDLRLKVSQQNHVFRISEFLYTEIETDTRKSGEKMFDYVDPKNREVQVEMEKACTVHLKNTGAWLQPEFREVTFSDTTFAVEASVIIPVKNRIKTIGDALQSVLNQQTSFEFNLIVVDNHSTDGTAELLDNLASKDKRVIHVKPKRNDLGIGGCWNEGIFHEKCGKFAIQLDSDDLYIDNNVVQRIVDAFYTQNSAMVVGSYLMVNFKLDEIPPGLIDHKEWTPENGRNNALRINGLGAPRAFYTPVVRSVRFPNVSYGEDYAMALAISRYYQIGRIYEPLYLCRRWDDNTDASLDVHKLNAHNAYKDKIRTIELLARIALNKMK